MKSFSTPNQIYELFCQNTQNNLLQRIKKSFTAYYTQKKNLLQRITLTINTITGVGIFLGYSNFLYFFGLLGFCVFFGFCLGFSIYATTSDTTILRVLYNLPTSNPLLLAPEFFPLSQLTPTLNALLSGLTTLNP